MVAVAASAWLCGTAQAQPPDGAVKKLPPVTVTATTTRGAVEKSYRKMIAGMDLFERMHSLAPAASLRYKLLPRQPGTDMDRIDLEVLGDTVAIPVRVAADHTFTLERDSKAAAENAAVTPNRRAQSMTWRVEIRTPGLPPDTRRLGDMRLECLVGNKPALYRIRGRSSAILRAHSPHSWTTASRKSRNTSSSPTVRCLVSSW